MLNEQEQLRFMRLWTAAQPAVSGYVRALVRDRAVADEVLQETSLVLFRRFDEYDDTRIHYLASGEGGISHSLVGQRARTD